MKLYMLCNNKRYQGSDTLSFDFELGLFTFKIGSLSGDCRRQFLVISFSNNLP